MKKILLFISILFVFGLGRLTAQVSIYDMHSNSQGLKQYDGSTYTRPNSNDARYGNEQTGAAYADNDRHSNNSSNSWPQNTESYTLSSQAEKLDSPQSGADMSKTNNNYFVIIEPNNFPTAKIPSHGLVVGYHLTK